MSLRGGSVWHIGLSIPLRRNSPTIVTHLFFFVEVVVIQGIVLSDPINTSSQMDPHSHHPFTGLPHPEPHTCCTEVPGRVRWSRGIFTCHAARNSKYVDKFSLGCIELASTRKCGSPQEVMPCQTQKVLKFTFFRYHVAIDKRLTIRIYIVQPVASYGQPAFSRHLFTREGRTVCYFAVQREQEQAIKQKQLAIF